MYVCLAMSAWLRAPPRNYLSALWLQPHTSEHYVRPAGRGRSKLCAAAARCLAGSRGRLLGRGPGDAASPLLPSVTRPCRPHMRPNAHALKRGTARCACVRPHRLFWPACCVRCDEDVWWSAYATPWGFPQRRFDAS